jgi:hypothetical protein
MRSVIAGLGFAALFAGSALAQTATIQPVQGDLSLNQGQGFQRVDGRISANVGDSVMVGPQGAATVVYPDGCQVGIQPGAVATIAPLSPCASGSFAADNGLGDSPWLLGGLAVGGAAGLLIYEATQRSSAPASP